MSKEEVKIEPTTEFKLIYVCSFPERISLKVGESHVITNKSSSELVDNHEDLNKAAHKRIRDFTRTPGIPYKLLYTTLAVNNKNKSFSDTEVRDILVNSGIKKDYELKKQTGATEWVFANLDIIKKAVVACKEGRYSLNPGEVFKNIPDITFRPEQEEYINKVVNMFSNKNVLKKGQQHFLCNAKMRYGKTLTTLQIVKKLQFKRTIIITHRPVLDEEWGKEFRLIFKEEDTNFKFIKRDMKNKLSEILKQEEKNIICFASLQDLRGSNEAGGKYDKNDEIFYTEWDLIIVDEAHEGTLTSLGKNVIGQLTTNHLDSKTIYLSGTPYNLLLESSGIDFKTSEIFTWDYIEEQEAKNNWDKNNLNGSRNPYEDLPKLSIFTYDLPSVYSNKFGKFQSLDDKSFDFREFFKINSQEDVEEDPSLIEGEFKYKKYINNFLDLLASEKGYNYPFSTVEYRESFRHTLWMLPGVKEAKELSKILKKHSLFHSYKIVNVAGEGDNYDSREAREKVLYEITDNPEETKTITLSCGRLTTGVTIKAWTAVLMLYGSSDTSASSYLQTIFRVQSPGEIGGKIKTNCYVFDFAPDRTLKILTQVNEFNAERLNLSEEEKTKRLQKFLNFCPVIGLEKSSMVSYDTNRLMMQVKKILIDRVARSGFADKNLYKLDLLLEISNEKINEIKSTINQAFKNNNKNKKVVINDQGLADRELEKLKKKKELSEEEKQDLRKRIERRNLIGLLSAISIRIPLLIYGADIDINQDIGVEEFTSIVDDKSWEEFMPKGFTKEQFNKIVPYFDNEIFIGAGRKIRQSVLIADSYPVVERIKKIVELFSTFKNPDKETILTPWKVVNMHLGFTLGGESFYNKEFSEEINIDEQTGTRTIPNNIYSKEVFNNDSRILEINSKTGLYPLYVAYSIYYSKLQTTSRRKDLWEEVLKNNIFIICRTKMAKLITIRTLIGYNKKINQNDLNIVVYDNMVEEMKKDYKNNYENVIKKIKKYERFMKRSDDELKFDAVVGNPPYHIDDGGAGASAAPIYQFFVDLAKKMKPNFITMIMPARWYAGGKGLDQFRKEMLLDKKTRKIFDIPNANDCFQGVDIKGGIMFFLWDRNYEGLCEVNNMVEGKIISKQNREMFEKNIDIFVRDNRSLSILEKVLSKSTKSFADIVSSRKPFGLATNFNDFVETKKEGFLKIYANQKTGYIDPNKINKNLDKIKDYKIFVPEAIGSGDVEKDTINPILAEPFSVATETYLMIGPFKDKETTLNAKKYIETKFFHFMLSYKKITQHTTQKVYEFIPLLDFSKQWDDEKLFLMFELNDEEKKYILDKVR